MRTLARTAVGHPERSPLVQATSAKKIKVKLNRKVLYEVDGGSREKVKAFTVKVQPAAITICLPKEELETEWQQFNLIPSRRCAAHVRGANGSSGLAPSRSLSRAGFVARALVYGIIGLLAFDLAIGHGGKITNQQGALRTVEQRSFGHLLLALAGDRPRRLRAVAALPGRARSRLPRGPTAASSGSAPSAAGSSTR